MERVLISRAQDMENKIKTICYGLNTIITHVGNQGIGRPRYHDTTLHRRITIIKYDVVPIRGQI